MLKYSVIQGPPREQLGWLALELSSLSLGLRFALIDSLKLVSVFFKYCPQLGKPIVVGLRKVEELFVH